MELCGAVLLLAATRALAHDTWLSLGGAAGGAGPHVAAQRLARTGLRVKGSTLPAP